MIIWEFFFKRTLLCTSSKKLFHFKVFWCINDYVVHFVKGRFPNTNTHQWKNKIQLSSSFLYFQVCWSVFFLKGKLLECFKLIWKLQEPRTLDPQFFSFKLKNTWGSQVPSFSLLATSLGNGCLAFLIHEKETWAQEGLGFFFVVATSSSDGHSTFLIHDRNTQV